MIKKKLHEGQQYGIDLAGCSGETSNDVQSTSFSYSTVELSLHPNLK
jgi:hypothetical protein